MDTQTPNIPPAKASAAAPNTEKATKKQQTAKKRQATTPVDTEKYAGSSRLLRRRTYAMAAQVQNQATKPTNHIMAKAEEAAMATKEHTGPIKETVHSTRMATKA